MRYFIEDCLKSDNYIYQSFDRLRGEPADAPSPTEVHLRPADELFAFKWPELPLVAREKIANKIRHMYGYELDHYEVLRIFKCLMARDIEMPLPYMVKRKQQANKETKIVRKVFNEKTFCYDKVCETVTTNNPEECHYEVYDFWGDESTATYHAVSKNLLGEQEKYLTKEGAEDACLHMATAAIVRYIGGEMEAGSPRMRLVDRLKDIDWEIPEQKFHFTKAMFMECPREFHEEYSDWHYVDNKLLATIERHNLPTVVDDKFIAWIASGCRKSHFFKTHHKLSASNAHNIKTSVDWGWLGRGNIVAYYHGFDFEVLKKLEVGTVFSATVNAKKVNYVVLKIRYDGPTKMVAYAKEGTPINDNGQIASADIKIGLETYLIESCWDELFDINRVGKKKKILKNVKILKNANNEAHY